MASAIYQAFRQAIRHRMQITCTYQGHTRVLCPHTLGHKNGQEKVLSYQFAGGSSKGLPPGGQWRCMFLDEVSAVTAHHGPWHTGSGHSRPQTCVDQIDEEV